VVFAVSLPASGDPRPTTPKAAPATATEWDRIRKELHGEKPDAGPAVAAARPSVGDVVLRVLAENGKHFRGLDSGAWVTVNVTFRPVRVPPTVRTGQTANRAAAPLFAPAPATGSGAADAPRSIRDLELLGDLHIKQQQYDKALEALRRAAEAAEAAVKEAPADPSRLKTLGDINSKQAQALLAIGRLDEARALLEKAQQLKVGPKPVTPPKPADVGRLPARLVISARKGLLDQVGDGKIDFETFRRQATIEYLTFGEEKKE
jgi:hypothetical protein